MKKVLLAVAFVILVGVAALFLFNRTAITPAPTDTKSSSSNTEPAQPVANSSTSATPAATITYTDNGFEPMTTKVKSGDTVKVINNSSHSLQFSSDPHPVHTTNKELNEETISAGASSSFTVTKTGTFGYHDHLDSQNVGTLIVE
jgi:plastocyanin